MMGVITETETHREREREDMANKGEEVNTLKMEIMGAKGKEGGEKKNLSNLLQTFEGKQFGGWDREERGENGK